jgi:hypothetical protein
MKRKAIFLALAVLLWAGCASHPTAPPSNVQSQQSAQPPAQAPADTAAQPNAEAVPPDAAGEAGGGGAVRAASPFGTRAPASSEGVREGATIPRGTSLRVRLAEAVDSREGAGRRFTATLDTPVLHGAHVAIPKGTVFTGHLTSAKSSGRLRGRAVLGMTLDSFELNGRSYPIATNGVSRVSADHKRRNLGFIGGGSALGAAIGAIAGGGKGALIGAGAGAAAGTAGAAATGKRNIHLPAETPLSFSLQRPVNL